MAFLKKFSIFTLIGGIQSLLQILLLWWLIDILHLNTAITTAIVVIVLYLLKYLVYVSINLMHRKFWKYNAVNLGVAGFYVLAMWLLVDILGWKALFASIMMTGIVFLLRFVLLDRWGMFKE
ncbi:GtrA family protein [Candidatus Woesearchaeota archaeon]|nr:GtrA family protein [Candidatus Woesearchaeota archaeon]